MTYRKTEHSLNMCHGFNKFYFLVCMLAATWRMPIFIPTSFVWRFGEFWKCVNCFRRACTLSRIARARRIWPEEVLFDPVGLGLEDFFIDMEVRFSVSMNFTPVENLSCPMPSRDIYVVLVKEKWQHKQKLLGCYGSHHIKKLSCTSFSQLFFNPYKW